MSDHIQDWKPRWECADRGACNWPMCGCDPYADKVMDALRERGILTTPRVSSP